MSEERKTPMVSSKESLKDEDFVNLGRGQEKPAQAPFAQPLVDDDPMDKVLENAVEQGIPVLHKTDKVGHLIELPDRFEWETNLRAAERKMKKDRALAVVAVIKQGLHLDLKNGIKSIWVSELTALVNDLNGAGAQQR